MFDWLNDAIMATAGSPWIYLIVLFGVFADAFFPPIPSETIVVAAAALGLATGTPNPWIIMVLAAVGAIAGDNVTYWMGSKIGLTRFRWMRAERTVTAFDWARRGLEKRAGALIFTGRYIPVGRVAVNLVAGATGLPRRRFVPLSILSGISWALYSVGIGVWAGAWFRETPLLGVAIAVGFALVVGLVIDRIGAARATASPITRVRATMREDHARIQSQ